MAMEATGPTEPAIPAPAAVGTALAPVAPQPHRIHSPWRKAMTATVALAVAAVVALAVALATLAAAVVGGLLALAALAARLFPRRADLAAKTDAPEGWTLEPASPR